ncbi:MAG: SAM-dependent methyltransferase [Parvularcula sp.]|jgi:predicted TPR repeat methyltransferase|nr:SAM-dependent methyltransferase [Parvularcula sp.]
MSVSGSLGADYFEGIFASDEDPWNLASSEYERRKFDRTISALRGRRYRNAIEVGCAHGVLTQRLLPLCDRLLAIDISKTALRLARRRLGDQTGLDLARMAFPREAPQGRFDLCVLSEVAYYWDRYDLVAAAAWLREHLDKGGQVLLVHYTGKTDYPMRADEAVGVLQQTTETAFRQSCQERHDCYRLDLWARQ